MIARKVIILLCVVALIGCVAVGPIYKNAPEPNESDALVYIYRATLTYIAAGGATPFYVNGVNIAALNVEGYTWFHLPAGEYSLKHDWGPWSLRKPIELKVKWLPNHKYFYRLFTFEEGGYFVWRFYEVSAKQGATEMSASKLQPAFGVQKVLDQTKRQ